MTLGPDSSVARPRSNPGPLPVLRLGRDDVELEEVLRAIDAEVELQLDATPEYRAWLEAGPAWIERRMAEGDRLYGITTGFGDSCETTVVRELAGELQQNLVRYHGCGTGPLLDRRAARAVTIVRTISLAKGYSGVRASLLERLCTFVSRGVVPQIPAHGSVGASGDLTPLSYLAAALVGERDVEFGGETMSAAAAHAQLGLEPLRLAAKEGLALMNGTSVMTALGVLAWQRARTLSRWATAVTAAAVDVLRGHPGHFDARIDGLKPHPGQQRCARWLREDLEFSGRHDRESERLQDRYSLRCAPHVIGVLLDAVDATQSILRVEVNSVNDNPLIDPRTGDVIHGGNFYGGHVAFALDGLKTAVANVSGLLDRQLALLCNPTTNHGLPANLAAAPPGEAAAHHGFKAMQIAASALTAEALKSCMPASVFSRSTECHNQDIVSMGTHAAHDCLHVLEHAETVGAIMTLAVCQAFDLRQGDGCHRRLRALHAAVRNRVPALERDRRQDVDIAAVLELLRGELLPMGDLQ